MPGSVSEPAGGITLLCRHEMNCHWAHFSCGEDFTPGDLGEAMFFPLLQHKEERIPDQK